MTKKILFGILVCFACFVMVSCSMDEYAKLGELMGNMGNNVYGIKANMQDVENTTAQLNNSVETTPDSEGNPTVTVTLVESDDLDKFVTSVASIKNSTQKTEELRNQLDTPLASDTATEDEKKAIQSALQDKMEEVISNVSSDENKEKVENLDDKFDGVKKAYSAVTTALSNIKDGISENPTKADLATVSIVKDLATAVSSLADELTSTGESSLTDDELKAKVVAQADKAFAALDALKVTTTAGTIDILNDISFTSLVKSFTSGSADNASGISKEGDSEDESSSKSDFSKYEKALEDALNSIAKMVSDGSGNFSEEKYNKFMFQLRAIRTAYEMTAWLATPTIDVSSIQVNADAANEFAFIDALLGNSSIRLKKFSTNDAVLYTIAFALTEGEDFYNSYGTDTSKNVVKEVLKSYVEYFANGKYENDSQKAASRWDEIEELVKGVDLGNSNSETYDFATFYSNVKTALNTDLVIILDAGFNLKGTLESFKVLSKTGTQTYADAIFEGIFKALESKFGKDKGAN